jgi:glycosyltransferase involved in cell wall biosynthesis
LRLARRLGVPFFLTPFLHLGDPDDARDATRRAYTGRPLLALIQGADRVFVQTDLERKALTEQGVPSEKLVLQGLGVDVAECTGGDRERVRAEWGAKEGEVAIGHLANKSEEKGTVDLLKAAEIAWGRGGHFHLVLAGPEMPSFTRFWATFPQAARVKRLGVLTDREKRDFFAGLDVFALPSRSDSFGLVLLEAWANGLPNVAYRAGGIAEVIRDERDGLFARCGDITGLAAVLERLVADSHLRHRLGQAGRERTLRDFGWEKKLRVVAREYEKFAARDIARATTR